MYSTASGITTFQVQLARFTNPNELNPIGGSLFKPTAATGTPELGNPGENGFGELQQGFIELSNVDVHEEMANLCLAAQAYHVTAEALRVAEKLLLLNEKLEP
jgi:flagellar basal-body rod protein FlgG